MVGTGRLRRGAIIAAMVIAGAGPRPSTVAAAEDATQILPGITVTALTTDLDGDGDREIVRLVQEENRLEHAVDAWRHDAAGWAAIGSQPMPRATEEDVETSTLSDAAATLLPWRAAGRERVLALSAALVPGDPNGATCCLTISEVQLTSGGDLDLRLVQRIEVGAQSVWAADVDGDGSDDLVLHEGRDGATEDEQTATLRVLRWDGTGFEPAFEQTDRQLLYGLSVADTDGAAGKDLLFGPGSDGRIRRFAWAGGEIRIDQAQIDAGEPPDGWIVGVADGAIVLSLGQETRVVRWPRGEAATTVDRLGTLGNADIVLVGDGPDALVVHSNFAFGNRGSPTVAIHDLGLRLLGEVGVSPATEGVWRFVNTQGTNTRSVQRNIHPYSGPIGGGFVGGRAAYVSSGMLIQPGGPNGYEARRIASLIGVQPIGLAGPQDAWLALGGNYSPPPGVAYLNWGGVPPEWGRLAVMPLDRFLQLDGEAADVSVELVGAVEVARDGEVATLMAEGDGFQVAITAPAGSGAIVVDRLLADEHEVGDEPLLVDVAPRRNAQEGENQAFEAMLLVVTPDGRGFTERWAGTFVREPPEISVTATTDAMSLSATLAGRAGPGSVVDADGVAIRTDGDGRFSASIDAPIWPSRVLVTARDALGTEATALVEVVGVVDYRGLPWAAIVVAATLIVAGALYVRTPKRRAALPEGDGRLEELELDVVDGSEPGGR